MVHQPSDSEPSDLNMQREPAGNHHGNGHVTAGIKQTSKFIEMGTLAVCLVLLASVVGRSSTSAVSSLCL